MRWQTVVAVFVILLVALVTVSSLELLVRATYTLVVASTTGLTFGDDGYGNGWYALSPEFGWVPRPHFSGNVYFEFRQFDGDGFLEVDRAQIERSERPRVVFIGDSTTYGYGVDTPDTFVEILDRWFTDADMINLGVPAYTSTQGYRVLRRHGLALDPAVLVFSFNFNDRRYVTSEENIDDADRFADSYWALFRARTVERMFAYRAGVSLLANLSPIGLSAERISLDFGFSEARDSEVLTPDRMQARVGPEQYARNLTSVAELSRQHGFGLVFIEFNDNPRTTYNLEQGIAMHRQSRTDEAIKYLQAAAELNDEFSALARLQLSSIYEELGQDEEALGVLLLDQHDWLHGEMPMHRDGVYNEVMRRVARDHDVPLIDASRSLDEDPSMYIDFAHFDERGHEIVAGLLRDVITDLLAAPGGQTGSSAASRAP